MILLSTGLIAPVSAQITPDQTLGDAERSIVNRNEIIRGIESDRISGGAIRGSNLFHSFQEFNIDEGRGAYFSNPVGIETILTRITGNNPSDIFGTLGVLGQADLFLLNPNGVVFGENARLDIAGSFVVSTDNQFTFADGQTFSASQPNDPPLLSLNITPGLQHGTAASGFIANDGVLQVGGDLTLDSHHLDLEGQLYGGDRLHLYGDTIAIRDTATTPFIATAADQLLVEGRQGIDIFALNHPDSGLFAGGDLILRSSQSVLGDAHYWAGGDFRIEQMNQGPGAWESPHDPIIRASGDVRFDRYEGASLHIFAGGQVILGDVTITGVDDTGNAIQETVTLSTGESLEIDGVTRPTLDIRAGTRAVGTPSMVGSGNFISDEFSLEEAATGSNIRINNLNILQPNGQVLLTNQYRRDRSLNNGNIYLGSINTGDGFNLLAQYLENGSERVDPNNIRSDVFSGQGGDVIVDARGDIRLPNSGLINTSSATGNAGNITLIANGDIRIIGNDNVEPNRFGGLLTESTGVGDAGTVDITAQNLILEGQNGDVRISTSTYGEGQGGDISLLVDDTISIGGSPIDNIFDVQAYRTTLTGIFANTEEDGDAGNISIQANHLELEGGAIASLTSGDSPNFTSAPDDRLITGLVASEPSEGNAGQINISTSGSLTLNARLNPENGESQAVTTSFIYSYPQGIGEAGDISIETQNLTLLNGSQLTSGDIFSRQGNTGRISALASNIRLEGIGVTENNFFTQSAISSSNIMLNTQNLWMDAGAQISASTFDGAGGRLAGEITVTASRNIQLNGVVEGYPISTGIFSQAQNAGENDGGSVTVTAEKLILTNGARISTGIRFTDTENNDNPPSGNGGDLTIVAEDSIELRGQSNDIPSRLFTESQGTGNAGQLFVFTPILHISDGAEITVSGGEFGGAGDLVIDSPRIFMDDGKLNASTSSDTPGGNIRIQQQGFSDFGLLTFQNESFISTSAGGDGAASTGGDITINTNFVSSTSNSNIAANSFGGAGGSIEITADSIFGGLAVRTVDELRNAAGVEGSDISEPDELSQQVPTNDITAFSLNDPSLSGTVTISTPEVDPTNGTVVLPNQLVDVTGLISSECAASSRFVRTGRGGLPRSPTDFLGPATITVPWLNRDDLESDRPLSQTQVREITTPEAVPSLTEVQGWLVATNGDVVLTAETVTVPSSPVQQGWDAFDAGDVEGAIALWLDAAATFAEQGDRLNYATSLNALAHAYSHLGEWDAALQATHASQTLLTPSPESAPSSAQQQLLGEVLMMRGKLETRLGQAQNALTTWQQAVAVYSNLGNENEALYSQMQQAQSLQTLGQYADAQAVLAAVTNALETAPDSVLKATGLRSYGDLLRAMGELEAAAARLQESLAIATRLQDPEVLSAIHLSLGNTARALGDSDTALAAYQEVATTAPTPDLALQAQINEISLLADTGRFLSVGSLWPTVRQQVLQLSSSRDTAYAQINLAQSLIQLRQLSPIGAASPDEMIELLASAQGISRDLGDRRTESFALGYLGSVYEQAEDWENAQAQTQAALAIAQTLQSPDVSYRWQWQLGRIYQAQGEREKAIAAYEAAFGSVGSLRAELATATNEAQFSFRETVEPLYREFVGVLLAGASADDLTLALQTADTLQSGTLANPLERARQVMESLQLAELDDFFQDSCLNAQPTQIDQVDNRAAVVYPIILADSLEVILSIPGQPLRHYSTPIPKRQLESTVNLLSRSLFRAPIQTGRYDRQDYLPDAQKLYDWLIRPGAAALQASGVESLVFVLDGALRNIPMAVLHDGDRYLIEDYGMAIAPGLQLLEPQPFAPGNIETLAAGLTQSRFDFDALPNVGNEIRQIQAQVDSEVLMDETFTYGNLQTLAQRQDFQVVHLATHGQFSSDADQTFVLAWDAPINPTELEALLREISPDLLVLSACQTATGDDRAALGLAGVAVRAGARSTLATLWFVSDEATSALMQQFYHELSTTPGITKAEALRRSQLSLLSNPSFQHPLFWASYVLVGNWL
ncbi:MAG: CHAT domain-containing protein [Leptolyngbyaceae bacterium]|nr:CHAT domain-containing protein [Leptolyngbyaceae bacterium]